jgi:high-affinity iron transporter
VQFLYNAGVINVLGATVWNTSWVLSEDSLVGQLFHTLIGYTSQPTQLQLIVYVGTLLVMYVLMRVARYQPRQAVQAAE